jgi:CubicO group peptidase (beta-lactamase class C family)
MDIELLNQIDSYIKLKRYRLINSILVYQDNAVVFERYYNNCNQNSRHHIKSIWKSILSICIGICVDKGYIKSLDTPICEYMDEFNIKTHPFHRMITIRHLLTMTSGIYWNPGIHYHAPMFEQMIRSKDWLEYIADINVSDIPGTKYNYKEWDVILLSVVIEKASSMTSYQLCDQYLYKPLGIVSGQWAKSPCGITYNISPNEPILEDLSDLSAADLAKIGHLFLNGGVYNGQRIISESYIRQALIPSEHNGGYGYLWWLFDDYYGCRGYGGQEINVVPKQKLVYVIQATATMGSKFYADIFKDYVYKAL